MLNPKTATQKAANIANKYNSKYNKNEHGGNIAYAVVEVKHKFNQTKNAQELNYIAESIENIQSQLKGEDRVVLFIGCSSSSHVKVVIVTKDYVLLNRNDSISPHIEKYLNNKPNLKVASVISYMEEESRGRILMSYLQADEGCATVAGKISKHIANMSNEEIALCIKENPNKTNVINQNIKSYIEGFYYSFHPDKNLMQNIMKYSQMKRFDEHLSIFHNLNIDDLYESKLNTKLPGNENPNKNLTLEEYIGQHSERDKYGKLRRKKLEKEEAKVENMPLKEKVKVLTPLELVTQNLNFVR